MGTSYRGSEAFMILCSSNSKQPSLNNHPPFPPQLKYIRSVDAVGYTDEELDFFPDGDDDSDSVRANTPGLMADLKLADRNPSARCCSGKFLMHWSWMQTKRGGSIVELFEGYFDVSLSYGKLEYDGHACSIDSVFGFWVVCVRKDEDGKEIGIGSGSEDGDYCTVDYFIWNNRDMESTFDVHGAAHYWKALAIQAIELDEAGVDDIFNINILSAMHMLMHAWDEVSSETIRNCWHHTGTLVGENEDWADVFVAHDAPDSDESGESDVEMVDATSSTQAGWELVLKFAQSDWTLPHVEQELMTLLRDDYDAAYWRKPLKAVMDAEGNVAEAVSAVTLLMPSDFEDHPSQSLQPLSDWNQFASCSSQRC
ncbi:hypothetical protein IW262DRAFT_1486295 [Armillaria fumosa]|nr:hypothetical protein IW262DRAFT_1486295 [Armillaria fumosa]